jgi:NAD(P)-dependent dehydrogenase (short-subunit alcohol dehydrogenase family)
MASDISPSTSLIKPHLKKEKTMLDPQPLKGRTAIVTGSGQNIGEAIVKLFSAAGANVVVNGGSSRDKVDKVVDDIKVSGGNAIGVMADVGDADAVEAMVKQAADTFGTVDIAVSNVSIRKKQPVEDISVEEWQDTINTNLNSAFYLARCVVPLMKQGGWGRIIHISGVDGFAAHVPTRTHNITCKAGVHAFAKALALELGPSGITANTVSPGAIDTTRDWSQYDDPEVWKKARIESIPVKRIGTVDDIANACLFLAGETGGFITGEVIHVNGGQFRF